MEDYFNRNHIRRFTLEEDMFDTVPNTEPNILRMGYGDMFYSEQNIHRMGNAIEDTNPYGNACGYRYR